MTERKITFDDIEEYLETKNDYCVYLGWMTKNVFVANFGISLLGIWEIDTNRNDVVVLWELVKEHLKTVSEFFVNRQMNSATRDNLQFAIESAFTKLLPADSWRRYV